MFRLSSPFDEAVEVPARFIHTLDHQVHPSGRGSRPERVEQGEGLVPWPLGNDQHPAVGLVRRVADKPEFEKPSPSAIRRSITPGALISFIDGKPYQTLKRHLRTNGLDIEGYRARYGLPADYPATGANYSATRAELARKMGLGRKVTRTPQTHAVGIDATPSDETAPKRRGRPPKAA